MNNQSSEENVTSVIPEGWLPIHFTSYSSLNILHACPKKLEIDKLGASSDNDIKNINFTCGKAVGAGIQELWKSQDYEKALLAAFLAWDMDLIEGMDLGNPNKHSPKSFPYVIHALKQFLPFFNILSQEYELLYFDYKGEQTPAIELSARVRLPHDFVYRIYIDLVLKHKESGQVYVVEIKTDGAKWVQEAKYGNSNQALSYSVILDKIAPGNTSFIVWYLVYYTSLEKWEFLPFTKSRIQKANWIRTVLSDTRHIYEYLTDGFFPKQGESCLDYNYPCKYYGVCDLSANALRASSEVLVQRVKKELATPYMFDFTIEDIIDQQLTGIK